MIEAMFLACVVAQDAAPAKAADAALFDELIRKTNELGAFVAVYRVRVPKEENELSIRITYRAPGELKCEISGHGLTCMRGGDLEVRMSSSDGKPMSASVPLGKQSEARWNRFSDILRGEFAAAASDWPATLAYGPAVEMKMVPDEKSTKESFDFRTEYAFPRTAVCGWLETFKRWTDTSTEDEDHILFRTSRGSELSLSKRTGFIDSIRKENPEGVSSLELETLDLAPKLDDHSFEIPDPPADSSDASPEIAAQMQQSTTLVLRGALFGWLSRHVSDGKIEWNADARARVGKALEALHSDGIAVENEPWISSTRQWIDGLGGWLRDRYAGTAKTDDAARGELEAKTQAARKRIFDSLQELSKSRVSSLRIEAKAVPDATLRASLLELEQASVEAALEHSLQGPLLESFDAQVERAKSGG